MTKSPERRHSASDLARNRAIARDTLPAAVVLIASQASLELLDPKGGASVWNLLWCLVPLLPSGWLVWAQVRALRRADEYQRLRQLEAMAIGFAAAVLISMTGGLLDAAGVGSTRQSLQITFIGSVLVWALASGIKARQPR
jgi:hypothetical protein